MSEAGDHSAAKAGAGPTRRWVTWFFAGLLAVHVSLVLLNLRSGILVGLEFRQAQTAISAHFIQVEDNFSLAYPTPVLGKPWSIPMEFPLYQWTVVKLSNATGWSLTVSARLVSAASFYAMLPALFMLLGRVGIARDRRLLALAVVLSSPIYIFYSRAFLIEAMALAFAVWFLAAFVEAMQRRNGGWLALAILAGIGAALVKVTTFMVWCLPAAAYGGWLLWGDWRAGGFRRVPGTIAWGLAASLPALGAALWWVSTSDRIKRLNPSGADLASGNLFTFNFGSWSDRVSWENWCQLLRQWDAAVMPWWLALATAALALFFLRSQRRPALLALGVFVVAQLVFPRLYAIHDYYFYAAGLGLLLAAGCVLTGLLDSRLPRSLIWIAGGLLLLANLNHYRTGYFQLQKVVSVGGSGLADALRRTSPPDSVLIIIGDDWNSMLPYYARRRALMIRSGLEHHWDYLNRAFDDLRGEEIHALVTVGAQRANQEFIARVTDRFKLDREPTYVYDDRIDVYVSKAQRNRVLRNMGTNEQPFFHRVVMKGQPDAPADAPVSEGVEQMVHPDQARTIFAEMTPAPVRYNFAFAPTQIDYEGRKVIGAHPVSTLWFAPVPGYRRITCEFGILPGAYGSPEGHTDGADFIIAERSPDGTVNEIYRRRLDPFANPADRGLQVVRLNYQARAGTELFFRTEFGVGGAFDWCYWGRISIE